jgi:hypothetical protein
MALVIFVGGISLGFILGFVVMALLAVASLPSKPKRRQRAGVILHALTPSPASLALRWRPGRRPPSLVYP